MRKFTDKENEWIKVFVELKEKGVSHIQELQVAKILRETFSFIALKWTIDDNPQIYIYNESGTDNEMTDQQYYNICDFIYFVKELESLGFIAMQMLPSQKKEKEYNLLYDREAYEYNEYDDTFTPAKQQNDSVPEPVQAILKLLNKKDKQIFYLDFAYDLQKYGLGIIYPLPLAVDYVENGYKTLEDLRHNEQIDISRWSFIVALIAAICSLFFGIIQSCSTQTSDVVQYGKPERLNLSENFTVNPTDSLVSDTATIK